MSLVKSTATIGLYTMISRVFGYVRDVTIAASLGASMFSDAFFVAFRLPNFLRRLFAEGAFNSAFVPQFAGMLAVDGKDEAKKFADEVFSFLMMVLTVITVIFILFMPWLMMVLAPGFHGNAEKYDLTVTLTRITFPYIIFISAVSLMGGMLNSNNKFAAVAATPIIMNLCLIVAPTLFEPLTPSGAHALAWGVFFSGVAQYVWLAWFAHKQGMLPRFVRPRLNDNVKKLLRLIAPATLGAGAAQINLLVDLMIASYISSGVSYLYFADRISELPLAVIGIAVGTALLPMLSKQLREGKHDVANHTQNRAVEMALLLSLPASAALMVIAEPIINVMFQHGVFGPAETNKTYPALVAFAAGLPAFVLIKVLTPTFYANHDTKTPFIIATKCILVNFIFNLLLIFPFAHVGMAMATTIAAWLNVALLSHALHKRRMFMPDENLRKRLPRMLAACAVMAAALGILWHVLAPSFHEALPVRILLLAMMVTAGLGIFGVCVCLFHAVDRKQLMTYLRRKKRPIG